PSMPPSTVMQAKASSSAPRWGDRSACQNRRTGPGPRSAIIAKLAPQQPLQQRAGPVGRLQRIGVVVARQPVAKADAAAPRRAGIGGKERIQYAGATALQVQPAPRQ